jgi:ATP-dependent helicase YprA (DUF1998 family)/very-short-patch-repair endonuclease
MDVFNLHKHLIHDYANYVRSFIRIQDQRISEHVQNSFADGLLWPEPLIQLNPSFSTGGSINDLVKRGVLHAECSKIFRIQKGPELDGSPMQLHQHQAEAIEVAQKGHNYVLTTGTGSGKSLSYIVPIVDRVLRRGSGQGIQAIVVYPMNALANSQKGELEKFLCQGYPAGQPPVTFERYTGQENREMRDRIWREPPDILLTNYVMLELILTRIGERQLVKAAQNLQFLVLDELHTYRGRQGADVALLVRRLRNAVGSETLQCVGTSATMASEGSYDERQAKVAEVASTLFGSEVKREHVIGESLRRSTQVFEITDPGFISALKARVGDARRTPPVEYEQFIQDPLSRWLESTFGVRHDGDRLVRQQPKSTELAAEQLHQLTEVGVDQCAEAIRVGLLGGYLATPNPETGFPAFAFRLHQFISRGDAVFTSLEPEPDRYITVHGQQFVPGDREKILLPIAFCRECGQEYYTVTLDRDLETDKRFVVARDLLDRLPARGDAGFLYASANKPWNDDLEVAKNNVPEDWLEEHKGEQRIKPDRRNDLPKPIRLTTKGLEGEGHDWHFVPAPFRFCLCCGVSYAGRQSSDFAKLGTLGSEGRSTATTVLSLSAIRHLRQTDLAATAHKMLSFTDNRQDASLQAGHFNDFVEIGMLRAALHRATADAGAGGLGHDELTDKIFKTLDLPIETYASNPGVRFQQLHETEKALRNLLGYRIYRDLKRGWRITSPNLEQCGLLEIHYQSLIEVCAAEDVWEGKHPALAQSSPVVREKIARVLLDYMRRELAIKVEFLDPGKQERIMQAANQYLIPPWNFDEDEEKTLETARVLYPRPSTGRDSKENVFVSGRGGFGQYLRRSTTFDHVPKPSVIDTETIIRQLLEGLQVAGLVEVVDEPKKPGEVPGYQLKAGALLWRAGDGSNGYRDPIRSPSMPTSGTRTNPFFIEFYRTVAASLHGFEAREHTAQVPPDEREDRERNFRAGKLPVLYCSPTMELGVDISELNVVNMRNVPPTPANYAQRSGRAGRSGQPALVFSYCSTGSSHDQYFFKRPERMVSGTVSPPRLDLANEDLVRAHVQAIWLTESGINLQRSLQDILDLNQPDLKLPLLSGMQDDIDKQSSRKSALVRAQDVLSSIQPYLETAEWYTPQWLETVLHNIPQSFNQACDRWRSLYRTAYLQSETQHRIILDASRSEKDRDLAKSLRREAEAQLDLLRDAEDVAQSDFYSYRYFASEGFLPGYNFPRLPLSAFIPKRRTRQRDEFLTRPRFLAVSEFGPRSILYHEGSKYVVNRVMLPISETGEDILTQRAKQCSTCGYLHPIKTGSEGPDRCENCKDLLPTALHSLLRLQNVSTKRRDRINSDEEERMRLGYEVRTAVRFGEHQDRSNARTAVIEHPSKPLGQLKYGYAATLWRINLGWMRRKNPEQYGFVLDTERGYWAKNDLVLEDQNDLGDQDPQSPRSKRVIPYVEDRRNCLLIEPAGPPNEATMVSLLAALKNAIQVVYQLEDSELAAEILPSRGDPRSLLLYESAEGGAGVLRRLIDDAPALAQVARVALELCHYDPDTGADLGHGPRSTERCEAACYDCLLNYANQPAHAILDRTKIKPILLDWINASVSSSPGARTRTDHLQNLIKQTDSALERRWLELLDARGHRLPDRAQVLLSACKTQPDFMYDQAHVAVYIDGPHHEYPERQKRDAAQTDCLEDAGYTVLRFAHTEDWSALLDRYPSVFGAARTEATQSR